MSILCSCHRTHSGDSSGQSGQGDTKNTSGGHTVAIVLSIIFTVLLLGCVGEPRHENLLFFPHPASFHC